MPAYSYFCDYCREKTDITHGMNEKVDQCPKCQQKDQMRRVPPDFLIMKTREQMREQFASSHTPGEVVISTINETKEEIEKDRDALKRRVWEPKK